MDVYEAPGSDTAAVAYEGPWIRVSQGILLFTGGVYVLFGIVVAVLYGMFPLIDPNDSELLILGGVGIVMGLMCAGFGVLNWVAAIGLGRHAMWGFVLTLIVAAMYLTSICFPFGALMGYGLLFDEPTRKLFLK